MKRNGPGCHNWMDEPQPVCTPPEQPTSWAVPRHLYRLADELLIEWERSSSLHPGTLDMPDGTGGAGRSTYEQIARLACERARKEGRLTFGHVFEEEAAEVLAEQDEAKLQVELLQVMNICAKWLHKLRRNARLASLAHFVVNSQDPPR